MGLGNLLWKRAFTHLEGELNRRGYTTNMRDDPRQDSPERRVIRIVCRDNVVDLYIRNGYWTIDAWVYVADGWHHSNVGEVVEDRYRLGAGITKLDTGTPHGLVIDTLVCNFVLPEFGPGISPHPTASRIPGTRPGPAANLPTHSAAEPLLPAPQQTFAAAPGIDYADHDGDGHDHDYLDAYLVEGNDGDEDYEEEPDVVDLAGPARELLARPAPAVVEEGVVQHFAASGVNDMTDAVQAPAKLYLDEDFFPGLLVVAGHLLGYFPEGQTGVSTEQEPFLVSFRDITDIHLSVPEGLVLVIPKGVRSSTILKGNVLGLYMSMQTAHISLILDFPREEGAEQERERIGSFISTLLAQFASNRMN